jgi:hypothetical protein
MHEAAARMDARLSMAGAAQRAGTSWTTMRHFTVELEPAE